MTGILSACQLTTVIYLMTTRLYSKVKMSFLDMNFYQFNLFPLIKYILGIVGKSKFGDVVSAFFFSNELNFYLQNANTANKFI